MKNRTWMRSVLRRLPVVVVVAALLAVAPRPARAEGSMVELRSGEETIQAYLAVPEGAKKGGPAIVVIQEWWGLNDWVKSVVDRFAAAGYVAIAPDLYRGEVATEPELAHELMRGLPDERALRDVRAAATHLQKRPDMAPKKTAVIGFCMGGRLSLLSSLDKGPFDATVICYGSPETNPDRLKTLHGPVLGIYGAADRGLGKDQTDALQAGLAKAGRKGEVHVFPEAGHAFLNDKNPKAYNAEQAPKAWQMIDAFLAANLKPAK
jgi:carboxymethylenebutenolidase